MQDIIKGYPIPKVGHYKVCARSITYNQSAYIEDCLNGVAIQQTNFPFVHHVIDDCSTDGEQDVIKAWMDRECDMVHAEYYDNDICTITLANNNKNPNCTLVVYFLKKNMYGNPKKRELYKLWSDVCPYIALCEGDDYWTDPKKLQKQVDWLEEHQDYSMVCTDAVVDKNGIILDWSRYKQDSDISVDDMIKGGGSFVHTPSILVRSELMCNQPDFFRLCKVGDYPLQIWVVLNGKVRYFSNKSVTYRYMAQSSWNSAKSTIGLIKESDSWKNINEFLRNMNEYTSHRYHKVFVDRMIQHIYIGMIYSSCGRRSTKDYKYIKNKFKEEFCLMSLSKRIDIWLHIHKFDRLYYLKQRIDNML